MKFNSKSECIILERLADCSFYNYIVCKKTLLMVCIKAVSVSNNNPHFHLQKSCCFIKMRISTIITLLVTIIFFTINVIPYEISFGISLTMIGNNVYYVLPMDFREQRFIILFDTSFSALWVPDISCTNCE